MSLLGVDVGTTGCKAAVFAEDGRLLALSYREYDIQRPAPGRAELDTAEVWQKVQAVIAEAAAQAKATDNDPISALSVSSLGEATVPVSRDRGILGPSILAFDERGAEYVDALLEAPGDARLYDVNGNTFGNHYSLTKLQWMRDHQPELYERADAFLLWAGFIAFMLGGEPTVDYCLANRTLLFDVNRATWSDEAFAWSGIVPGKLPRTVPAGTCIGTVSPAIAASLGLPSGVAIVAGAHDQCANALGCGVVEPGQAMMGMGTYLCAVPVFTERPEAAAMMRYGLNTEHHAAPGRFVSFIYNHGGSLFKWYRDTFAAADRDAARAEGVDIYSRLIAEMPADPSSVVVVPHFAPTGPPRFISDSSGAIAGLRFDTRRGEILKAILESSVFYLRNAMEGLPAAGVTVDEFRAVGGGSRSDEWLQLSADILGCPMTRATCSEAGALGGAILAGWGTGRFASPQEGVAAMVGLDRRFEPNAEARGRYDARYGKYTRLTMVLDEYLRDCTRVE